MIVTVTPNPSIDLLYEAERLTWDDANRVEMPRRRAGGQGINLTRAARVFGVESFAVAFFGGAAGDELRQLLDRDRVAYSAIPIVAETRVFVAVRETATGRSLLVNPRGPILTSDDRAHLTDYVAEVCRDPRVDWIVCSGSIPRGLGNDLYAAIAQVAHGYGRKFIADCDGEPLELAVAQKCDLLAPNQHEAERLLGHDIQSLGAAVAAARDLLRHAPTVLLKLGAQGAILANDEGCWHARAAPIENGSAVGAGDAFLAAFLAAEKRKAPPEEALSDAVAAGSAVLMSQGSDLLTRGDYDVVRSQITITRL